MEIQKGAYRFDQAIASLPGRIREVLAALPRTVKAGVFEVRLRVDKPLCLTCPGQIWFVDVKSQLHNIPRPCFPVTPQELEETYLAMCSYSVHSHQNELKNGYISLKGGHRAGICGTAVVDGRRVSAVRDVTSINLRIARDVHGAADEVVGRLFQEEVRGMLLAGVPSSGKTTILRDLARQLSDGRTGRYLKVAVVDERCELGAVFEGIPQNDLGPGCDLLSGYPKGAGILMAVRTLSPHVIVCDEIGGEEEVDGMLDGLRCGVKIIASAHAGSIDELIGRRQIARLLREGAFDHIVLLGSADEPGSITGIVGMEDLRDEAGRYVVAPDVLDADGHPHGFEFIASGPSD